MAHNRQNRVYRFRQLPLHLEDRGATASFLSKIASVLGAVENIRVFSLSQEKPTSKTATVSFKTLPPVFDNDEEQWTLRVEDVCERNIIVDIHFRGFTVLKEPQNRDHTIDCIAISGLASHPFGSWKYREPGSDFMWLRDRLPQDVPQLRSLIYGYDTKLFKSHSFQDLDDIAGSFIARLKEIRRSLPPAKPLILLAHSLGGIVLKRALVLLAHEGDAEEKMIFESVKGLVFFGVPHKGMMNSHFLDMVAKQPNEDLISRTLSPKSPLLLELDENFAKIASSFHENIRFVYETAESQTTEAGLSLQLQERLLIFSQKTSTGTWIRSATSYAVLVNKDSAIPPGTLRRNAIAVDQDHSNMVKLGEDDPVYQVIMPFILDVSKSTENKTSSHVVPKSLNLLQDGVGTCSTVPFPRDPGFVGREDILKQLESEFASSISQHWASLHGLGGIGKSQIAIEYAYRQRERSSFLSTFWVHASSKARFEQSYVEIATAIKIPGIEDGKANTLQLVSKWLESPDNGPWLLVIDNADDATVLLDQPKSDAGAGSASVQRCLLDFLPRAQHGAVLITTRDRACALEITGHVGTPIEVQSMSKNEAVGLLRNRLPDATDEEASELVEELEYVPLAISQASAYIKAVSLVSIPRYLEVFRRSNEKQASLLNMNRRDMRRDPGVPNAVITSWELSFSQIREQSPDSAKMLSLMSYFNRQAIPQCLIQGDVDEFTFYESINPLLSFSLIRAEIRGDTFEMHRLVQIAMQHWLRSEGNDQLWKESAIERMAQEFPYSDQDKKWPVCEVLMSHADEVLSHTANSKKSQLNRAKVLGGTAWYLNQRKGLGRLAEQRMTDALEIRRQYFDEDSQEIFVFLNNLAAVYNDNSKYDEARGLQEYILKQRLEKRGPEDAETLTVMHNLAVSYYQLGHFEKAEDLIKRSLQGNEKILRPKDPQSLNSGNVLAEIHIKQGKFCEAEKLSTEILEMSTKHHGAECIQALIAMRNLSLAYLQQSKLDEAEKMIAQAIPLITKTFGPSHWRTLDARINLAAVERHQGRLNEAEEICISCLDTAQKVYGSQNSTTLNIQNLLGLIYLGQENFDDASRLLEMVVESSRKLLGANHPNMLTTMYNLALSYYNMGHKDQAIQMMTEVLVKRREVLHADHPYTAQSANLLARWRSVEEERDEWETEEEGSEEEENEEEENEEEDIMREQLAKVQISSRDTQEPASR